MHQLDDGQILDALDVDGTQPPWKKANQNRKKSAEEKKQEQKEAFEFAVANCHMGEPPTIKDLAEWYATDGVSAKEDTIRKWVKKFGFFIDLNTGLVHKIEENAQDGISNS